MANEFNLTMRREEDRLNSFRIHSALYGGRTREMYLRLAAARGYYFNVYNGRVQCFGCGHTLDQEHHEACPQEQLNIPSQQTARLNLTTLALTRGYYFNVYNGRVQCFGCGHTPAQEHHEACPQEQLNIPSQQTARLNLTTLALTRGYYFNVYNGRVECFGCAHTPDQEHHEACPQEQLNIPSQQTARLNLTTLALTRGYYFNAYNGRVQCFGCGHTPDQEHHEACPQEQLNIPSQQTARLNLTTLVDPQGFYNTCVYIRRHTDKN